MLSSLLNIPSIPLDSFLPSQSHLKPLKKRLSRGSCRLAFSKTSKVVFSLCLIWWFHKSEKTWGRISPSLWHDNAVQGDDTIKQREWQQRDLYKRIDREKFEYWNTWWVVTSSSSKSSLFSHSSFIRRGRSIPWRVLSLAASGGQHTEDGAPQAKESKRNRRRLAIVIPNGRGHALRVILIHRSLKFSQINAWRRSHRSEIQLRCGLLSSDIAGGVGWPDGGESTDRRIVWKFYCDTSQGRKGRGEERKGRTGTHHYRPIWMDRKKVERETEEHRSRLPEHLIPIA